MSRSAWASRFAAVLAALLAACSTAGTAGSKPAPDGGQAAGPAGNRAVASSAAAPPADASTSGATDAQGSSQPAMPADAAEPYIEDCGPWPPFEVSFPVVAACIGFESGEVPDGVVAVTDEAGTIDRHIEFRGTVLGAGWQTPQPPGYCFEYIMSQGEIFAGEQRLQASWLRLENERGEIALVGVIAPSFAWRALAGDAVVVVADQHTERALARTFTKLEVRRNEGELVAWVGSELDAKQLAGPPEVRLAQGLRHCRGSNSCLPEWAGYDLTVQLEGQEEPSPLRYGKQGTFGDFVVTHGGLHALVEPARCPQADVDTAIAGIWRKPF